MQWFRLWHDLKNSRKLRRVCRDCQIELAAGAGRWIFLLIAASESPVRGSLMLSPGIPLDDSDLADIIGCNVSETLQFVSSCKNVGLIDDDHHIIGWEDRQPASDNSTDRVKRYRSTLNETEMKRSKTVSKPFLKQHETLPDTDTDTEKEKKEKKRKGALRAQLSRSLSCDGEGKGSGPKPEHPLLSHPIAVAYAKHIAPLPKSVSARNKALDALKKIEKHPLYTHQAGIACLSHWWRDHEDPTKPLQYIAPAIWDMLNTYAVEDGDDPVEWPED